MYLCEILNRTDMFGPEGFQERFFYEPYFLRKLRIGENSSSIRLDRQVLWLDDVAELRSKKFRRLLLVLLYGSGQDVEAAVSSRLFREYRQMLYEIFAGKGLPEYLKIHRRHFFSFLGDEILDEPRLRSQFVSRDYILLDREDRVSQAVSLYIAYAKNQVIVTEETRASWEGGEVPCDENYLLTLYDMLNVPVRRDWTSFLSRAESEFGATVTTIGYEELQAKPAECVFTALRDRLGYDVDAEHVSDAVKAAKLKSSTRPENRTLACRLREALKRRSEESGQ